MGEEEGRKMVYRHPLCNVKLSKVQFSGVSEILLIRSKILLLYMVGFREKKYIVTCPDFNKVTVPCGNSDMDILSLKIK